MLNQRVNKIAARALAASLFVVGGTVVGSSQVMAMDNQINNPWMLQPNNNPYMNQINNPWMPQPNNNPYMNQINNPWMPQPNNSPYMNQINNPWMAQPDNNPYMRNNPGMAQPAPGSAPMVHNFDYCLKEEPNRITEALQRNVEVLQNKVKLLDEHSDLCLQQMNQKSLSEIKRLRLDWETTTEESTIARKELAAAQSEYLKARMQDMEEFDQRIHLHLNILKR